MCFGRRGVVSGDMESLGLCLTGCPDDLRPDNNEMTFLGEAWHVVGDGGTANG